MKIHKIAMKYLILPLLIMLLYSCSKNEQIDNVKKLIFNEEVNSDIKDLITCKFIPLETTDSCLFGDISAIDIVDNKIYTIDRKGNHLFVFDISGKFITQIGKKGNGPGEYMSLNNFHIDKKQQIITLTDAYIDKLFNYKLTDYKFINSKKTGYFSDCCWLPDGNIAWAFHGGYSSGKRDLHYAKITDPKLNTIKLLYPTNFFPESPMVPGQLFYTYNRKCYLNIPYVPTIYEVTSEKLIPTYQLELGQQKFASPEWLKAEAEKNFYGTISNTDYISGQHIKETDDYICVEYYARGMTSYLGFYNKNTGKSFKYSKSDFTRQTGLTGLFQLKGTYNNYFIFTMLPDALKDSYCTITELQPIIDNIKEDDNPILCLLKFK